MSTENFDKLSDEKRLSIINAGILCFSRSGYKKTAISEIAEEAGISKAAIFHYFSTKKDLYIFLYNYINEELYKSLATGIEKGIEDFFECAAVYMQARLRLCKTHPGMYELFRMHAKKTGFDEIEELSKIAKKRVKKDVSMIFSKVNVNKFLDCYDLDKISKLVSWIETGCLTELAETMSIEEVHSEMERYLHIIKKAVYKPEYL